MTIIFRGKPTTVPSSCAGDSREDYERRPERFFPNAWGRPLRELSIW